MTLRLDPAQPAVWRSPDSLQFGVDAPTVVLDAVSTAEERMLAALTAGVTRSGLEMIAGTAGATTGAAGRLLEVLAPALQGDDRAAGGPVALVGGSGTTRLIGDMLRERGIHAAIGAEDARLAVIVSDHVIAPEEHGRWLRRDVPHLPVVFGDRVVRIGPVVEPGSSACLFCLERHRTDADAAWPAIASQLWGRTSPLHSALTDAEAAAIAARRILERIERGPAAQAVSTELDAATGALALRRWEVHPACGCTADLTAGPPGNAMPCPAGPATRTGAGGAGHA